MSALGQKQTLQPEISMSALPAKADIGERNLMSALCQKADIKWHWGRRPDHISVGIALAHPMAKPCPILMPL
jgi:hypothetical protein